MSTAARSASLPRDAVTAAGGLVDTKLQPPPGRPKNVPPPVRFWTYVVEALRTVEPDVGAHALALLRVPQVSIVEVVLPELLNELGRLDRPLNLVLDDYHLVADAAIHESITFLINHLPETVFLLVATRSDPPLPIGRLRARGDLVEVRA